jgi:hypothetical protein
VNETFSHAVFFDNQNKQSRQSPSNHFGGLVEIKGKTIKICSWFQVCHNLMGSALHCYKKKLLCNLLGWEFQFLVPISGTPIGGGIPIPFKIPKIPVGFFFEITISGESENRNSDLQFLEFRQFLAQELSTSFCC